MSDEENIAIVESVLRREYVRGPREENGEEGATMQIVLDGRFSADELTALAWCFQNNKLPEGMRE